MHYEYNKNVDDKLECDNRSLIHCYYVFMWDTQLHTYMYVQTVHHAYAFA